MIYSLNMKNEEQEATLQALSYAHHEELHRVLMESCHEGEGSSALRIDPPPRAAGVSG